MKIIIIQTIMMCLAHMIIVIIVILIIMVCHCVDEYHYVHYQNGISFENSHEDFVDS